MTTRTRLLPAALLPIAAALALSASAHASVLTVTATNCGTPSASQVFMPWDDPSNYFLAPGGDFAGGSVGWSLTGGASDVAGGDGQSLGRNAPGTQSLSLPDGSSATTPAICVGTDNPSFRFFAEGPASSNSSLLVTATVVTTLGLTVTLPVADIGGSGTWDPTPVVPLLMSLLPVLPGNQTPITLTFTAQGTGANWQIDDLYVDPWTRGNGGGI